jgi:hypothetical protein
MPEFMQMGKKAIFPKPVIYPTSLLKEPHQENKGNRPHPYNEVWNGSKYQTAVFFALSKISADTSLTRSGDTPGNKF